MRMIGVVGWWAAVAWAEPIEARWGGREGAEMAVLGFDEAGLLRLASRDGSTGEARLPVEDIAQLHFTLPEAWPEAQRRAMAGRPAEALFLLERSMPSYVPYAVLPDSNVEAAVRFYFRLLLNEARWPEALAVAAELTADATRVPLGGDVLQLVRALLAAGRTGDAAWLLSRVPLGHPDLPFGARAEVARIADLLRQGGHWAEAESTYARLREQAEPADHGHWDARVAYCQWYQGQRLLAAAWVESHKSTGAFRRGNAGLNGLLAGLVWLERGEPSQALDELAETLVAIGAASEWRLEISAALARAYHAHGDAPLAAAIAADLRRLHPERAAALDLEFSL